MKRILIAALLLLLSACGGGSIGTGVGPLPWQSNSLVERDLSKATGAKISKAQVSLDAQISGSTLRITVRKDGSTLIGIPYLVERKGCEENDPWTFFKKDTTGLFGTSEEIDRTTWCAYRVTAPHKDRNYVEKVKVIKLIKD